MRNFKMSAAQAAALVAVSIVLVGCRGGATELAYVPATGGNAELGAARIREYGCGSCHIIPGIDDARGLVGPPLLLFGRRTFIAGQLPNQPENLVRWILSPSSVEPGTAMPDLGLTPEEAQDVAAYLYTLVDDQCLWGTT